MQYPDPKNIENERGSIGFAEWLWPVSNNIKAIYFVLTSISIIIVLAFRGWYEISMAASQPGLVEVAIEVIAFSPAAGFFSMFVMSIAVAGGMTVFGKNMFRQGVIIGEERGEKRGEARGIEIGEARGEARGIEIGEARGTSKSLYAAGDWYRRKTDAEARGEPFDEPPPWERDTNGTAHTDADD